MLYYHAGAERETDPPAPQRRLRVQPFYVGDQHGRQRLREVAVGRWHNDVTDRFEAHRARGRWIHGESSVTRAASHVELPPELAGGIGDSEAVRLVLFASDRESRQVLDALDARFPGATKLGIVGSQTPFLNGREYTLLADDQIHDSGVLGFAFAAQRCHLDQRRDIAGPPRVSYSGLEPISGALRIERCKGNVVLELEDGASIHLLVAALRGRRLAGGGAETDSQLFARIMRTRDMGAPCSDSAVPPPETGSMVLRVTGGNPAKGGLALDTLRDLAPGQYIQFLMPALDGHPRSASKSNGSTSADGVEVLFGACGSDGGSGQGSADPRPAGHCWPAGVAFGGATEGGFAYGRPRPHGSPAPEKDDGSVFSGSIECAVPGSTVALELK
ncbi:hypothetical protein LPJ61_000936 [Coemansia biformis]|uniref:FIST domain-containing protein n=1 Tax=Coemansia biformis TaxID=1286918 RepID=A0A9W7YHR3_9FUNG|nr:hypothetical protein LPJ61_000936 [Coemansia biformis]